MNIHFLGTSHIHIAVAITLLFFFCVPLVLYADESVIENTVSITSSSGGNIAENGSVTEGTTHSVVDIETVVNGEIVEYIHEETTSSNEPIEVHAEFIDEEDGDVYVTTDVIVTSTADGLVEGMLEEESGSAEEYDTQASILDRLTIFIAYVFSLFRA